MAPAIEKSSLGRIFSRRLLAISSFEERKRSGGGAKSSEKKKSGAEEAGEEGEKYSVNGGGPTPPFLVSSCPRQKEVIPVLRLLLLLRIESIHGSILTQQQPSKCESDDAVLVHCHVFLTIIRRVKEEEEEGREPQSAAS